MVDKDKMELLLHVATHRFLLIFPFREMVQEVSQGKLHNRRGSLQLTSQLFVGLANNAN